MPHAHVSRAKAVSPDDSRLVVCLSFCWEAMESNKKSKMRVYDRVLTKISSLACELNLYGALCPMTRAKTENMGYRAPRHSVGEMGIAAYERESCSVGFKWGRESYWFIGQMLVLLPVCSLWYEYGAVNLLPRIRVKELLGERALISVMGWCFI